MAGRAPRRGALGSWWAIRRSECSHAAISNSFALFVGRPTATTAQQVVASKQWPLVRGRRPCETIAQLAFKWQPLAALTSCSLSSRQTLSPFPAHLLALPPPPPLARLGDGQPQPVRDHLHHNRPLDTLLLRPAQVAGTHSAGHFRPDEQPLAEWLACRGQLAV